MAKEKVIAGLPVERGLTIREAVAVALVLGMAQAAKKVEKPKEPEKSKFRAVLRRRHDAHPGECREMSEKGSAFWNLCVRNGIPCTRRQASKYLQHRGRAWEAQQREIRENSRSTMALSGDPSIRS